MKLYILLSRKILMYIVYTFLALNLICDRNSKFCTHESDIFYHLLNTDTFDSIWEQLEETES